MKYQGLKGLNSLRSYKMQFVKSRLLDWSKSTFGYIKENKSRIWEEINQIDKVVEANGRIDENVTSRKTILLGDIDAILRGEEIHWNQKSHM